MAATKELALAITLIMLEPTLAIHAKFYFNSVAFLGGRQQYQYLQGAQLFIFGLVALELILTPSSDCHYYFQLALVGFVVEVVELDSPPTNSPNSHYS